MWTALLRHYKLSVFVLLVALVLLVLGWLELNHLAFISLVSAAAFGVVLFAAAWATWRQTTPDSLESRGMYADDSSIPNYDPGLRREYAPMLPFALGRRTARVPASRFPEARPSAARSSAPSPSALGSAAPRFPASRPVTGAARSPAARTPAARARPARARARNQPLHPETTVTFAGERQAAGVDDLFAALDRELIGLGPVKRKVDEIGSLLLVDQARQKFGLSASRPNLHMCFTGDPGTGKTTVALMMADLLHRLGYLASGQVVHAMRNDLVGEFIGQTAPKTKSVLSRAVGGVLFIDEAYSLYRGGDSKDYGQECIEILMQVMENDRDKIVVILAGYKDRMDHFFESNPGMRSRIAHHLDFAPYQADELIAIGELMLDRSSYYLSPAASEAFRAYLSREMVTERFANARSVRNSLEAARLRHAFRLAAQPDRPWTRDDLMRLEPADILNLD